MSYDLMYYSLLFNFFVTSFLTAIQVERIKRKHYDELSIVAEQ